MRREGGPASPPRSLFLALSCLLLALSPAGAGEGRDLADCEARFAAAPEAEESAACFSDAAQRDRSRKEEAAKRVQALLRRHPEHPWLTFHLGSLLWDQTARSADLFREAAGLFEERRMHMGAVRARSNLRLLLYRLNRYAEAEAEVRRGVQVAGESGDPSVLARARILEAAHLFDRNQDLRRAGELLSEAEAIVFPNGPYAMRRDCLHYQANVALALGRIDAARQRLRRLVELTVAYPYAQASARYTLLRALRDELALLPRPRAREECLDLARQSLAVAEAAGNSEIEAKSLAILGVLTPGPEAMPLFERCFEAAERLADKSHCRSMMARSLAAEEPEAALRAVDEALDLAQEAGSPAAVAYSWRERMRVSWRLGPPGQAVLDSLAALEAMEMLRDLQTATEGRAELFSTWVSHYHWLAGRLLEEHAAGKDPAALATAFEIQERMRARTLIDTLEAAQATGAAGQAADTADLQARRIAVLAEISRARRHGTPEDLRRLEIEGRDLREEIARADPAFAAFRGRGFAALESARKALAEDEALLSFQIAPWTDMMGDFYGGAWLIVATREAARAVPLRAPLADRPALRSAVETFTGLVRSVRSEAGDTGNEEGRDGAAALYRALLADGLAGLPAGIRRLVVIPDDALHQVPFAALRPSPDGEALAERYEITLVPSATLWLRWRDEGSSPAEAPVLVFADPAVSAAPNPPPVERAAMEDLGPLPWARREGKAAVGHLGGRSELRLGGEASEAYLKRNGPGRFGILHFATHARADSIEPDRSFVLLAAGGGEEDGLLRMREIVGLDLRRRIVVLSACSSASGEILRGEGVMGLARAFFQAGAHTVVASLWPLRDDHGAALFDRFYHHLGRGLSVSAALQAAQRDRLDDGAPTEAWAGVVILGDGGRVPLPGGRKRPGVWVWVVAGVALLLAASGLLLRRAHA